MYADRQKYDGQYTRAEVVVFIPYAPPENAQIRIALAEDNGTVVQETSLAAKTAGYTVAEVDMRGLAPGRYSWIAEIKSGNATVASTRRLMIRDVSSGAADTKLPVTVPLRLFSIAAANGGGYTGRCPMSMGLPLPRGAVKPDQVANIALFRGKKQVPCQKTVRGTWDRGASVRWAGLDFMADYENGVPAEYHVVIGREPARARTKQRLIVSEQDNRVEITTGPAKFVWTPHGKGLPSGAWFDADGNGRFTADEQVVKSGKNDGAYWVAQSVEGGRCDLTGDLTFTV